MEFDRKKKYKFLCYTLTSSRGMMCCLLYFFLLMMILPQTRISLNKKNCLGLGSFRHPLVKTPSPTKTRLGAVRGCPAPPKQLSAMAIRLALASLLTEIFRKKRGIELLQSILKQIIYSINTNSETFCQIHTQVYKF